MNPLPFLFLALSTPSRTKLILSHQSRAERSDKMFFGGLKESHWKVEKVAHDELNWEEGFIKDKVEIYYGVKEL